MTKRKALGKGLEALLPSKPGRGTGLLQIEVDRISPNPFQPRSRFESEKLEELAASIREHGVLQPVIVRRAGDDYELVAGERRWRAARKAGVDRVPALVHDLSDQNLLQLALVENLQRDDLSAIEEARAYQILIEEFDLTQQQVAQRVGRSRTGVANTLRLLKLPESIQQLVVEGRLSMGHARALLPLARGAQLALGKQAVRSGLSVRQVEDRVRRQLKSRPPVTKDPNLSAAEDRLEEHWKTRVEIRPRGQGGRIILHFHSPEELDRLYEALLSLADAET